MKLLILGAGGHGKVVMDCCVAAGHEVVGFLDDDATITEVLGAKVLGPTSAVNEFRDRCDGLALGLGKNVVRERVMRQCVENGWDFPVLLHPHSWVSPSAVIGDGAVVMAGCVIQAEARLGMGCIINTSASIDHDCRIGDFAHICPGANLAGQVSVGCRSLVGTGTSVIPQIEIGEDVTVGAGSAVIKNIADGITVAGAPAREI